MKAWALIQSHPLVLFVGYWGWRRVLLAACLHGLLIGSALLVAWNAQQSRNLYGELHRLQQEHDTLLQRQAQLLVERSMHADLTRVERTARDELRMQFPMIVSGGEQGVWISAGYVE